MKFNRKKLLLQKEVDYAMTMGHKMAQDDSNQKRYNKNYEKQLNINVKKFNENTNPSNFYYNFIFWDELSYKQRNVDNRYYPMLKYRHIKNFKKWSDNDIKQFMFKHQKRYKLNKLFRKTEHEIKQIF